MADKWTESWLSASKSRGKFLKNDFTILHDNLTDFNVALKVTRVTLWQPSFGRKKKAFITERVSCCFRSLAHSNTVHVIQKQQTRAYAARLKSALYGGRSAVMEKISLRHLFETTHVT